MKSCSKVLSIHLLCDGIKSMCLVVVGAVLELKPLCKNSEILHLVFINCTMPFCVLNTHIYIKAQFEIEKRKA